MLIRLGHLADGFGEPSRGSVTWLIVDVAHCGLDVLVAHERLNLDDVEHSDGDRPERMPQIVEPDRRRLVAQPTQARLFESRVEHVANLIAPPVGAGGRRENEISGVRELRAVGELPKGGRHIAHQRDRPDSSGLRGRITLGPAWAVFSALEIIALAAATGFALEGVDDTPIALRDLFDEDAPTFVSVASVAASLVVGVLVIAGVLRLRAAKRLTAYRLFERAMLVQIFIADFFSFVESQFSAVFGVGVDILLLITVRYMIRRESVRQRGTGAPPPVEPRARPVHEVARAA